MRPVWQNSCFGVHLQVYELLIEGNLGLCEIGQVGHHQQVLQEEEATMNKGLEKQGKEKLILACFNTVRDTFKDSSQMTNVRCLARVQGGRQGGHTSSTFSLLFSTTNKVFLG